MGVLSPAVVAAFSAATALGALRSVKLTRTSVGSFNTTAGTASTVATDLPVRAVRADYRAREIDGTRVRAGDRRYLIDASDAGLDGHVPDTTFTLSDGGVFSVVGVETDPASVLYILQVRR